MISQSDVVILCQLQAPSHYVLDDWEVMIGYRKHMHQCRIIKTHMMLRAQAYDALGEFRRRLDPVSGGSRRVLIGPLPFTKCPPNSNYPR